MQEIIENACKFGESIKMSRQMQSWYQGRPVLKHVFPLVEEFRYNALGVPPKSIHVMSDLGRIIYLDSETKLNQFDIAS